MERRLAAILAADVVGCTVPNLVVGREVPTT